MELIDLIPSSMSFRVIVTIDIEDEAQIPIGFTGRVRRHANESISYVAWYREGLLHNPGRRHPAYRRFRPDGKVKYDLFYTHGLLHDPTAEMPAARGYFADGKVHYEERYWAGRRQDSRDGKPAIRKWRNDGTIRHELHYCDGRRSTDDRCNVA